MATVEELQAEIARLQKELDEQKRINLASGPIIKVAPLRKPLQEQVLKLDLSGASLEDGARIPTQLHLLHASMTQRAAMAKRFKASKAAQALDASKKILATLIEKKVYQVCRTMAELSQYAQHLNIAHSVVLLLSVMAG